ncbi:MFS general substrate transporter [Lentinula raphanica]|uniref:MFS general substrate transporter n=1 Tax=Lentinula raphanica TaxID=153919 RepID=A0AA38P8G2_9AGAR|nr:MFS general substrate transporter [Lentinula raphanica]
MDQIVNDNHQMRNLATNALDSTPGLRMTTMDLVNQNDDGPEQIIAPPTRIYQTMLVLAGSMMIFHIIGLNQVFGIFQVELMEFYTSSQSNIKGVQGQDALVSLVGSIGTGLTWSGSIIMNPLIARIDNIKLVTLTGAFIMSFGLVLASFATHIWHLYLTQALLYGLGSSMYYFPLMTLAPTYFDRHRGFAMGMILAGSGVGGLVMALVLQFLLDHYGIQWALRILGIWNLAVAIPVSMVVRHRPGFGFGSQALRGTNRARATINKALLKRGTFWYQSIGAFLQAAGNVVPLYYMTSYTVSVLSLSRSEGSLFVSINSGVNSLSRIAMGLLADYIGRQNTLIGGAMLSAVSVFALWYNAQEARFIGFVVLYGIYAGGYNALLPTTITEIYGVENYASIPGPAGMTRPGLVKTLGINGVLYFIRGLGSIFGAPMAGLILGSHSRSSAASSSTKSNPLGLGLVQKRYNEVVIFDGMLLLAGAVCVGYVRWLDARDKGAWRWKA